MVEGQHFRHGKSDIRAQQLEHGQPLAHLNGEIRIEPTVTETKSQTRLFHHGPEYFLLS